MASEFVAPVSQNATLPATAPVVESVVGNATAPVSSGAGSLAGSVTSSVSEATQSAAVAVPSSLADGTFSWTGYFQAIAVLLLLLAVLWGVVWLARKYGKFNFMPQPGAFPRDALRVEAQVPLGPRKGLVVVRFLNKRVLLGVTDQQITYLTEAGNHHEQECTDFQELMDAAQRQKSDL